MVVDTVTPIDSKPYRGLSGRSLDARLTTCPAVHNVSGIEKKGPLITVSVKHAARLVCVCLFISNLGQKTPYLKYVKVCIRPPTNMHKTVVDKFCHQSGGRYPRPLTCFLFFSAGHEATPAPRRRYTKRRKLKHHLSLYPPPFFAPRTCSEMKDPSLSLPSRLSDLPILVLPLFFGSNK